MRAPGVVCPVVLGVFVFLAVSCQPAPREGNAAQRAANASTQAESGPVRDLARDEEAGGHTLRKHVGQTDEQLQERLQREPYIVAASTYTDRRTAEHAVGAAIAQNRDRIERWLEKRTGHPNLALDYYGDASHPFGRTLRRGENRPQPCSHAVVVLRWSGRGEYYVLTSYPECR